MLCFVVRMKAVIFTKMQLTYSTTYLFLKQGAQAAEPCGVCGHIRE